METELDFLLKILLDFKISKELKTLLQHRIKEVQTRPTIVHQAPAPIPAPHVGARPNRPAPTAQQPSTAKILQENPDLIPEGETLEVVPTPEVIPVNQIAQTPAAAQALAQRQQMMNNRGTGLAQGPSRFKPISTK
jgi:hypothetical protein